MTQTENTEDDIIPRFSEAVDKLFAGVYGEDCLAYVKSLRTQLAESETRNKNIMNAWEADQKIGQENLGRLRDALLQLAEKGKELAESHNDWKETHAAYRGVNKAHNEKIARISELEEQLEAIRKQTVEECAQVAETESEPEGAPTSLIHTLTAVEAAIMGVHLTKKGIAERIRALSQPAEGESQNG